MFYGTYIGNDRMLIKTQWGMRLIVSSYDMSLMPTLLVDGVMEQGLTNWLLKNRTNFRGKKVVDVGANIGYFTVLLACIVGDGKVYAYEANPKVYDILMENIYLSQLQNTVVPFNRAVGDRTGITEFYVSKKYQGNSSLVEHTDRYLEQFATDEFEEITVDIEELNIYRNDEIELVKIDVEGAELDVFNGMCQLIINKKVKNIVFELNKNMLGEKSSTLYRELEYYREHYGALYYLFTPEGEIKFAKLDDIFANDYVDNILVKFS
jgi:FkbM family methyltransferase